MPLLKLRSLRYKISLLLPLTGHSFAAQDALLRQVGKLGSLIGHAYANLDCF